MVTHPSGTVFERVARATNGSRVVINASVWGPIAAHLGAGRDDDVALWVSTCTN